MRTYITPIYIIIWEFLLLRLVCKCVKIVLKWGKIFGGLEKKSYLCSGNQGIVPR